MPSRCRVFAMCLLVAVIGTLTMIVAVVKLKTHLAVAREQRAIANLVKAGAGVQLCNEGDGTTYYAVLLAGCESCESNDELLRYVPDMENVGVLTLAPLPLHEAGRESLSRLKGLASLGVYVTDTGLSHEMYVELKREMKLRNPDVVILASDKNGKPVE